MNLFFKKKKIFNPFDDIDNLIESIFSNPDILKDFNFENINLVFNNEEKNDDIDYVEISNSDIDDNEIVVEIIYDNNSEIDKEEDSDNNEIIDPINFITESSESENSESENSESENSENSESSESDSWSGSDD